MSAEFRHGAHLKLERVMLKSSLLAKSLLSSALVVLCLPGCSAKIGDMVSLSDASMEQKLYQRIEHFNRARYWGSSQEALSYVEPEFRPEFLQTERASASNSRIVRSEIADLNMNDDGSAEVQLEVQYFEQPTYVVRTRREKQNWQFMRYSGGWLMTGNELLAVGDTKESEPTISRGRMRALGSY